VIFIRSIDDCNVSNAYRGFYTKINSDTRYIDKCIKRIFRRTAEYTHAHGLLTERRRGGFISNSRFCDTLKLVGRKIERRAESVLLNVTLLRWNYRQYLRTFATEFLGGIRKRRRIFVLRSLAIIITNIICVRVNRYVPSVPRMDTTNMITVSSACRPEARSRIYTAFTVDIIIIIIVVIGK